MLSEKSKMENNTDLNYAEFFFFFLVLGLHLQHMEVPRLRVQSELQLLAYTPQPQPRNIQAVSATLQLTAMPDH